MGMNLAMAEVTAHIGPNDVITSTQNILILEKHCVHFTYRKRWTTLCNEMTIHVNIFPYIYSASYTTLLWKFQCKVNTYYFELEENYPFVHPYTCFIDSQHKLYM